VLRSLTDDATIGPHASALLTSSHGRRTMYTYQDRCALSRSVGVGAHWLVVWETGAYLGDVLKQAIDQLVTIS